jgi:hypothetical protein
LIFKNKVINDTYGTVKVITVRLRMEGKKEWKEGRKE